MVERHTPAPWRTLNADLSNKNMRQVIGPVIAANTISEADANLIAQAPALLEALIKLRSACMGFVPECAEEVDAVIDAATGKAP